MTVALSRVPRRRVSSRASQLRAAVVALLILAMASAAAVLIPQIRAGHHRAAVGETLAYERAIIGPARQGGFVIQMGMKPAVARLAANEADPATFQAVGWVDQLEDARRKFNAAPSPEALRPATADFDAALRIYEEAARTLGAAAIGSGDARRTLLDRAVASARRADARYNRASAKLQARRRALGLRPTDAFPDPAGR